MYTATLLDDIKNRELKIALHSRISKILPVILAAGLTLSGLGTLHAQEQPKQELPQDVVETVYTQENNQLTRIYTTRDKRHYRETGEVHPNEKLPTNLEQALKGEVDGLELEEVTSWENQLPPEEIAKLQAKTIEIEEVFLGKNSDGAIRQFIKDKEGKYFECPLNMNFKKYAYIQGDKPKASFEVDEPERVTAAEKEELKSRTIEVEEVFFGKAENGQISRFVKDKEGGFFVAPLTGKLNAYVYTQTDKQAVKLATRPEPVSEEEVEAYLTLVEQNKKAAYNRSVATYLKYKAANNRSVATYLKYKAAKQDAVTQVVSAHQRNLYSDPNLAYAVQGITESTYLGRTRDGKITRVVTDTRGNSYYMFGLLNPNDAPIPGEPFQTPPDVILDDIRINSKDLPQPLTPAEIQQLVAHPEAYSLVESTNQVKLNSQIYNVSRQKAFDDMAVTFTYLCGKHRTPKGIINLGARQNYLSKLGWRVDYKTGAPTLEEQPPVLEQLGEAIGDLFGM